MIGNARGSLAQTGSVITLRKGAADETALEKGDNTGTATFKLPNRSGTVVLASSPLATGTPGAATAVTAVGGVTALAAEPHEIIWVAGSGGPVVVTATPQISAGTVVGQRLTLIGTSNTNTVSLAHGNGLSLNGVCLLTATQALDLVWNGTVWFELSRRA